MFSRIVTHDDFDGVVSAAICAAIYETSKIIFTGPVAITESRVLITEEDIVCDLPYPLCCGLWFDHHDGNLQAVKLRGIDPSSIPGEFSLKPSCARVVLDYFSRDYELDEDFAEMAREADRIDSFDYVSVEEWRADTPAHRIDCALKAKSSSQREKFSFYRDLVLKLRDSSLGETAELTGVRKRMEIYRKEEEGILKIISENSLFLREDGGKEMLIIDISGFSKKPYILKNLAYLLFPNVLAVLLIQGCYPGGIKNTDLSLSLSLGLVMQRREHKKDVGEIVRSLNLGDGHPGAAAGIIHSSSRREMLKNRGRVLSELFRMWKSQG